MRRSLARRGGDPDRRRQTPGLASAAPAVLNYIFAERDRQEPALVAAIVLSGNLASLLVIPLALPVLLG